MTQACLARSVRHSCSLAAQAVQIPAELGGSPVGLLGQTTSARPCPESTFPGSTAGDITLVHPVSLSLTEALLELFSSRLAALRQQILVGPIELRIIPHDRAIETGTLIGSGGRVARITRRWRKVGGNRRRTRGVVGPGRRSKSRSGSERATAAWLHHGSRLRSLVPQRRERITRSDRVQAVIHHGGRSGVLVRLGEVAEQHGVLRDVDYFRALFGLTTTRRSRDECETNRGRESRDHLHMFACY